MPRLARAGRRIRKPIWPGRGRSGVNGLGTGEGFSTIESSKLTDIAS